MTSSIHKYDKPSVTIDLVLYRAYREKAIGRKRGEMQVEILLVERNREPEKGVLALPGGFVSIDQTFDDTITEVMDKKVGIKNNFFMEQLETRDEIRRDKRGRIISVSYIGMITEMPKEFKPEVKWVNIKDIHKYDLAFDHNAIVQTSLERIKGKMFYTDIILNLLPEKFVIRDIQDICESFIGEPLTNFKRNILKVLPIKGTEKTEENTLYRPAEIFKRIV